MNPDPDSRLHVSPFWTLTANHGQPRQRRPVRRGRNAGPGGGDVLPERLPGSMDNLNQSR